MPQFAGTKAIPTDSLNRAWNCQQHSFSKCASFAVGCTRVSRRTRATPRGTRSENVQGVPLQGTSGAGDKRCEADVHLTKRESVEEFETLGGSESVPLATMWDGRFHGLDQEDLRTLQAVGEFELRLPGDRKGRAEVPNGRDLAYLQGVGDPPF